MVTSNYGSLESISYTTSIGYFFDRVTYSYQVIDYVSIPW